VLEYRFTQIALMGQMDQMKLTETTSDDGLAANPLSVSATELVRDIGRVRERVLDGPIHITSHGRADMVLLSQAEFNRMLNVSSNDVDRLEAKLTTVIDTVDMIIVIFDQDLRVRRVNKAYCDHFQKQAKDLIGMSAWNLMSHPSDQFLTIRMKEALKSGREEHLEMPSSYREGRQMRYTLKPWPLGVAFFARDVTDEVNATDRIMRDVALDLALATVPDVGTGIVDNRGEITLAPRSLSNLLGSNHQGLVGSSIFNVIHPEDRGEMETLLASQSMETQTIQIRYLRGGTEYRKVDLAASPYAASRNEHCFAIAMRDIGSA